MRTVKFLIILSLFLQITVENSFAKERERILLLPMVSGGFENERVLEIERSLTKEFEKEFLVIRGKKCEDKTSRKFHSLPNEIKLLDTLEKKTKSNNKSKLSIHSTITAGSKRKVHVKLLKLELPDTLKKKLKYDKQSKVLTYSGVMSRGDRDVLLALSGDIQYQMGIEILFDKSHSNNCLKMASAKFKTNIATRLTIKKSMAEQSINLTIVDISKNKIFFSYRWSCHVFDERQLADALKKIIADGKKSIANLLKAKEKAENQESEEEPTDKAKIPLTIDSRPTADIYINNKRIGKTPFNKEISQEAGEATIRLKNRLYLEHKFDTVLNGNNNSFETIELVPNFGTFQVDSYQENATVTITDWGCSVMSSGITPFEQKVPKGRYLITVSKNGYESLRIPKAITSGLTVVIGKQKASLRKLMGEVTFFSTPYIDGAELFIDGKKIGSIPTIKTITVGNKVVEVISDKMKGRITINVEDRKELTTNIKLEDIPHEMVMLKGGFYEMGDFKNLGEDDEKPLHKVYLVPFAIDKYEVTTLDYATVTMKNQSFFYTCPDCPVENVTWFEADDYCKKVGKRLPTEAEWEYAARGAEGDAIMAIGDETMGAEDANFNASSRYKEHYSQSGKFRKKTVPVGSFKPNSLGLYDMSGNVWEWVSDWYDPKYYSNSPIYNAKGASGGLLKVIRGGSWYNSPATLRTTNRNALNPIARNSRTGFRCAK